MGKHVATVAGAIVAALVAWAVTTALGLFEPWWVRALLALALGAVIETVAVIILLRSSRPKSRVNIARNVKSGGDIKIANVKARTPQDTQTNIASDLSAKGSVDLRGLESDSL